MQRLLFIALCFVAIPGRAQSIYPFTLNMGGGSYKSNTLQVDWSIAESTSVQTFIGKGELLLSSGILQPYTLQNDVFVPNGSTNWLSSEIVGYPIPTQSILLVDIKISESGRMNLQLMAGFGKILFSRTFDYTKINGAQRIDLTPFPPGIYYLNATLSAPSSSMILRAGSFKIIKM